jgi:hypothetical protein
LALDPRLLDVRGRGFADPARFRVRGSQRGFGLGAQARDVLAGRL